MLYVIRENWVKESVKARARLYGPFYYVGHRRSDFVQQTRDISKAKKFVQVRQARAVLVAAYRTASKGQVEVIEVP